MSINDDIRADVIGTRGRDRSDEIRLEVAIGKLKAEVERLTAERDEYAAVALAGLGGIVATPEKGYVKDGGPGQLRADFRELRKLVKGLTEKVDRLSGPAMTMIMCTACGRGVRGRDSYEGRCPHCAVAKLKAEVERLNVDLARAAKELHAYAAATAAGLAAIPGIGIHANPFLIDGGPGLLAEGLRRAKAEVERLQVPEPDPRIGKFVVIEDGKVVMSSCDYEEALGVGYRLFGPRPFAVWHVAEKEEVERI